MLSWLTPGHYMELEFFEEMPTEFFYKDKLSGDLADAEFDESQDFPEIMIQKIKIFI